MKSEIARNFYLAGNEIARINSSAKVKLQSVYLQHVDSRNSAGTVPIGVVTALIRTKLNYYPTNTFWRLRSVN
jgi:hypothetical protein